MHTSLRSSLWMLLVAAFLFAGCGLFDSNGGTGDGRDSGDGGGQAAVIVSTPEAV